MRAIWSDQRKHSTWRRLWVVLAECQRELGLPITEQQIAELRASVDNIDFDRALSTRERGFAWSIDKMLEDHLYWVLVYWRWLNDANFEKGPKAFFKRAPALIRPLVIWKVRGKVRNTLHAHGIGRHNEADMTAMSDRAFEALSLLLGENRYLMGDQVCGADATAFAFIAGSLCPLFDSPAHAKARTLPNLIAYRDRMMAEYYPKMVAA